MDGIEKRSDKKRTEEKINQFIIECLFKKYFEEKKDQERIDIQKEEISV